MEKDATVNTLDKHREQNGNLDELSIFYSLGVPRIFSEDDFPEPTGRRITLLRRLQRSKGPCQPDSRRCQKVEAVGW
jgi:hypothetical protein